MTDPKAHLDEPQSSTEEAAAHSAAVDMAAAARQVAEHEAATARARLERARDDREAAKLSQPLAADEAAAQETALARLKLERATVDRDIAKFARPWWRSWNITALGAVMAAIAPATAGVTGHFERAKQIALEDQKQRHEIFMAQQRQNEDIRGRYLDRIVDPKQARRTMRLLIATSEEPAVRAWAAAEVPHLDGDARIMDEEQAALVRRADEDEKLLHRVLDAKGSDELIKRVADMVGMSRAAAANHMAATSAKPGAPVADRPPRDPARVGTQSTSPF